MWCGEPGGEVVLEAEVQARRDAKVGRAKGRLKEMFEKPQTGAEERFEGSRTLATFLSGRWPSPTASKQFKALS